jgi:hypothetical protein
MTTLLFTVEDTFLIEGRGLVLAPGLGRDARCCVGDSISLKRPDGRVIESVISGIALGGVNANGIDILLKGLEKDDVPIGTEVWSVEQSKVG